MQFPLTKINEFFKSSGDEEGINSLWGDFGVGKTTLSLQTAKSHALINKKVLYLYTKPNIPLNKIRTVFDSNLKEVLEYISFMYIPNFEEIFNFVFNLEFSLLSDLKAKKGTFNLIIIDSMTDLYRIELNREKKSKNFILNYKLNQLLANLVNLTQKYELNTLIVNEISRRTHGGEIHELESGGNVMQYWVTDSIKIERTDVANNRRLVLSRRNDNNSLTLDSMLTECGFE